MDLNDMIAEKKKNKEKDNVNKRLEISDETSEASLERLRKLYQRTEEMKEASKSKSEQIDDQFKNLKDRLANSTGFLNQIKKSIDNIKFGYQRDISTLEKVTEENRLDIEEHIEEIRKHITRLRSGVEKTKEMTNKSPQTYEEAINDVVNHFHRAARGKFTSSDE